jgi:hypothetical protein
MVSDFVEYYRLAAYLFRYTHRRIGLAMGALNLKEIFDEQYYTKLEGGILESFGRLFKNNLKLFVYPYIDPQTRQLVSIDNLEVAPSLRQLYGYLVDRGCIVGLTDIDHSYLGIYSDDVLAKIVMGSGDWESMVPPAVAATIKARGLFGYRTREALAG